MNLSLFLLRLQTKKATFKFEGLVNELFSNRHIDMSLAFLDNEEYYFSSHQLQHCNLRLYDLIVHSKKDNQSPSTGEIHQGQNQTHEHQLLPSSMV